MVKKFSIFIFLFLFTVISSNLFAVNESSILSDNPGITIYENAKKSLGMIYITFDISYGGKTEKTGQLGTGWFFDEKNPYILTNNHVVDIPDIIKYETMFGVFELIVTNKKYLFIDNDGKEHDCHVVATCPKMDMAMLKVDIDKWDALKIGDPNKLRVAEKIYAIGAPYGLINSYSEGHITYLNRKLKGLPEVIGWIQHSAPINPGNSGGPLINSNGEVVGINTLGMSDSDGIGFASPINLFRFPWFWTIVDKKEFPEIE